MTVNIDFRLPDPKLSAAVATALQAWDNQDICKRIWEKDHTVWSPDPAELSNRLGWLDLPEVSLDQVDEIQAFAAEIRDAGMRHVVLLGMGGSSLAPEVFARTFGSTARYPELIVLDSTHPEAVRTVEDFIDPVKTLFLVASKSGTTLETMSFYRTFWERVSRVTSTPGVHFVAITDPGSALDEMATDRQFRRVFAAPPTVGGRYSALSVFGLVPAALIGVDIRRLLERARSMAAASSDSVVASENPSLQLGVTLAQAALFGVDKVTFFGSPTIAALPIWIEQLVAESVGKEGKGIVPVDGEASSSPEGYGRDRLFIALSLVGDGDNEIVHRLNALEANGHPVVHIRLQNQFDLGAEMFRWELATAAAGAVLGIHPFNQPDVQLAKSLAKEAMASQGSAATGGEENAVDAADTTALSKAIAEWAKASPGDYLALQAYVAPSEKNGALLQEIRTLLGQRLGLASTIGFGPRFLHSTGQLHKGGANNGLFLQLVDAPKEDLPVPETNFTFAELIKAQAMGDAKALTQRGRRILRVDLGPDTIAGLEKVRAAVG